RGASAPAAVRGGGPSLGGALPAGTAGRRLPARAAALRCPLGRATALSSRGRLPAAPALGHAAGLRLGGGVDRDVDAEGEAALEIAAEGGQLLLVAVGEDPVGLEGQLVEVLGGSGVALEREHLAALGLGQGDLGGEDRV